MLTLQKTFASSALFSLSHDIAAHRELRGRPSGFTCRSTIPTAGWSARPDRSRQLPVLHYLLNVDYFMLRKTCRQAGITNVVAERERRNATRVGYQGFPALVDSLYYRVYLIGDYGFIVMKEPPHGRLLQW